MTTALRTQIEEKFVQEQWSPQQISGWLARKQLDDISHERIYQHILRDKAQGDSLYQHLRQSQKKHKKRHGKLDKRGSIPHTKFIGERPVAVKHKQRLC